MENLSSDDIINGVGLLRGMKVRVVIEEGNERVGEILGSGLVSVPVFSNTEYGMAPTVTNQYTVFFYREFETNRLRFFDPAISEVYIIT